MLSCTFHSVSLLRLLLMMVLAGAVAQRFQLSAALSRVGRGHHHRIRATATCTC